MVLLLHSISYETGVLKFGTRFRPHHVRRVLRLGVQHLCTVAVVHVLTSLLYPRSGLTEFVQIWCVAGRP